MAEVGTGAAQGQFAWVRNITRYQWLVFFGVWAGWSLDAADFGLYSLVLAPAVRELLGGAGAPADIRRGRGLRMPGGLVRRGLGRFPFGGILGFARRVGRR